MIYIVSHIPLSEDKYNNPDYKILPVGQTYTSHGEDNINNLNLYINELTGFYYLWKNCNDEYIGINHYRRIFVDNSGKWISINDAKDIIDYRGFDIICTPLYKEYISLENTLTMQHKVDERVLKKYLNILYTREHGLQNYFHNTVEFNPKNMLICKKDIFDRYCSWLFPLILPIVDIFIHEDVNNTIEKRLLGFIFERLLTYWISKEYLHKYSLEVHQLSTDMYK